MITYQRVPGLRDPTLRVKPHAMRSGLALIPQMNTFDKSPIDALIATHGFSEI